MDDVPAPGGRPAVPPVAEQLRGQLIGLVKLLHNQLEQYSGDRGLTAPQSLAMFQLGRSDATPMRDLAGSLRFDPSYVTALADGLESLGLVERQPHPEDRRIKLLVLTMHGHAVRSELIDALNEGMPGIAALDPREQRTLVELLGRMLDAAGGTAWGTC